ncbi:PREDICTED: probable lipid-A-disaccharide synthase, mitochondrial [Tarenaya hassleriana]|uniref:probable lipid-A-disaccharide synthase, mitochondrial n=1 Tax=Tarenaya hassleriana TaxID=28532 RepID=UPI00053C5704|nr:PREDICTED: probable lipid-A-disaccharide synthase, mitochondrial [Tarenaya hassleriana]
MFQIVKNRFSASFSTLTKRYFSIRGKTVIDAASKDGELRVFIVSGEVSGDTIGSRLMGSLRKLSPLPVRFHGVGGSLMCKQGLKSLFPMEDIAVMGIWELLPHLFKFHVKLKETIEAVTKFKPHVVVTVDSKGFSFRLLKEIRARYNQWGLENSPIHFHYVAPSFWAWRGGESRLGGLSQFVDHIFCILPNEEAVCRANGLEATFVGHPILEDAIEFNSAGKCMPYKWKIQGNPKEFFGKYSLPSDSTVISVLPGSRLQEVERMLPIFAKAMELLKGSSFPKLVTLIHVASNSHVERYIGEFLRDWPVPVILVPGGSTKLKYDAFSVSQAALCTSGTVAVELQLARLPCLVAYRAHFLTEMFIRYKAKIPYISLPNILLGSPIIPEALFQSCNPLNLSAILGKLISDEEMREDQAAAAEKFASLLHPSQRDIHNFLPRTGLGSQHYTPSFLAASTILCFAKP